MPTSYPTTLDTDNSLWLAKSGLKCTLTVDPGAGGTTINVDSTTGFPATGFVGLDAEMVQYAALTGTAFTGCTRGADGTSASAHTVNTTVYGSVAADHHNALKDAVKALEAKVGVNSGGSTGSSIDAGQLAASSTANIAGLNVSGTGTASAGFRDTRGVAGFNVPFLFDHATPTTGTYTTPTLPAGRNIRIYWTSKCDNGTAQVIAIRVNGDSSGSYAYQATQMNGTSVTTAFTGGATSVRVGVVADSSGVRLNGGVIDIPQFSTAFQHEVVAQCHRSDASVTNTIGSESNTGSWFTQAAITSITFFLAAGNFVSATIDTYVLP